MQARSPKKEQGGVLGLPVSRSTEMVGIASGGSRHRLGTAAGGGRQRKPRAGSPKTPRQAGALSWARWQAGDVGTAGPCTVDGCALLHGAGGSPEAMVMGWLARGHSQVPVLECQLRADRHHRESRQ